MPEERSEFPKKYVVESFSRGSPDGPCKQHFEFDDVEEASKCARHIIDRSLKRTRGASRSAIEWYRRWAACGEFVVAPDAGFDSRKYAKLRIRMMDQGFEWITQASGVKESDASPFVIINV